MNNRIINYQNLNLINKTNNFFLDQNKSMLRFLTCGNVDDGKSTLIGRLLYDNNNLYKDELNCLYKHSSNYLSKDKTKIDLSFVVDGLQAEREQGITIDVAYRYFSTEKRKFIIADTPGHEQYTKNMATGASTCDLAIMLIDVRKGITQQTKRHSFICILLGIKHIIIAINKMDLVKYSENLFNNIKINYINFINKFSKNQINIYFIPISALLGDNVVKPTKCMTWYDGPTLLKTLETAQVTHELNNQATRFPIQYVNRQDLEFRSYAGTLISGSLSVDQKIKILPSGLNSSIKEIITFDGNLLKAEAGQSITISLNDNIDISRGDIIVSIDDMIKSSKSAMIDVIWMSKKPLCLNDSVDIKIANKKTCAFINKIINYVNMDTLQRNDTNILHLNNIGLIKVDFQEPLVLDEYYKNPVTGGMIFIDKLNNNTVGAGIVKIPIFIKNNINVLKYKNFEIELNKLIHRFFYN